MREQLLVKYLKETAEYICKDKKAPSLLKRSSYTVIECSYAITIMRPMW